ncbi:hypothetical protein HN51_051573 [Arachis hypogaea]|uniref:NDR1/HIN1-like protein 13 n=1 Tax=Arachis ipaensis TaxID=130454 RepID=UPI0007AF39E5|nr:NDR1/HIN1-like protein 13 [Arachis ipaensis]XP_025667655.1 NDR1/HIN1-like protein 13 [Arachis hypogaea]QHN92754.1 uncharacterized protein DS421_17g586630 [Arachis hypogaea]
MEERTPSFSLPQSPKVDPNQNQLCKLQLENINNNGTYVIQVPRDQVYRVPPPENARIAEKYQKTTVKVDRKRRCWIYARIVMYIGIVLCIGCLLIGFYIMLNKPKDPRFVIQQFSFQNGTNPTYNITLQVHNPNSKAGILYKEGQVSLSAKQQEIASGAFPTVFQEHCSSTTMTLKLKELKDNNLPKEVQESVTNVNKKVHVTFSLTMQYHAGITTWKLRDGKKKYHVLCQVTVDSLTEDTNVLSQDCQTLL